MIKKNKVVYIHRRKTDGTPFYVGEGKPTRPFQVKAKRDGFPWGRNDEWVEEFEQHGLEVEIVAEGLTKKQALRLESKLIKKYGRKLDGGILVNRCLYGRKQDSALRAGVPKPKARIPIVQLSKQGHFIKVWESAKEAANELKGAPSGTYITKALKGTKKSAYGFCWEYYDENKSYQHSLLVSDEPDNYRLYGTMTCPKCNKEISASSGGTNHIKYCKIIP